jgi:hypothetical protein
MLIAVLIKRTDQKRHLPFDRPIEAEWLDGRLLGVLYSSWKVCCAEYIQANVATIISSTFYREWELRTLYVCLTYACQERQILHVYHIFVICLDYLCWLFQASNSLIWFWSLISSLASSASSFAVAMLQPFGAYSAYAVHVHLLQYVLVIVDLNASECEKGAD